MNAIVFLAIIALASPIYGEDALPTKKQDKRGVTGLGYGGGHYGGSSGLGLGGSSGYGHGYLNSAPTYSLGHGIAAAPIASVAHSAPISVSHGYTAPVIASPLSVGHGGIGYGLGSSHGLDYGHGW